jgi:hypothetical protein
MVRIEPTGRSTGNASALICAINQRPAGPGGASARNAADNVGHAPLFGISTTSRITSAPESRSAWTRSSGIPPQPMPALRNACFAPKSASRQGLPDTTPNSVPFDKLLRSVSTSWTCPDRSLIVSGPRWRPSGCEGRTAFCRTLRHDLSCLVEHHPHHLVPRTLVLAG